MEAGRMTCMVTCEHLSTTGSTLKRTQHRTAELVLMRNEHRDIILKFLVNKREQKFNVRDVQIHKKFAKDGKATIKFPKNNIQLLLSNCPPDQLIIFLKTMVAKYECLKHKGFATDRQRLLSEKPRLLEEISPLNVGDLQSLHQIRAKQEEKKPDLFTPKGKLKRKRDSEVDEKENTRENGLKLARKELSRPLTSSQVLKKSVTAPVTLNVDQNRVLKAVLSGHNLFFTGSAGTGKSFLLRRIIGALPPQHTFATASTGVAACHIGGTTLHAFAGIGSGKASLEQCVELASRSVIAKQWKKCSYLIIDEISMVDGDFFDKLETIARVIKGNDKPFGGIQLILCGDFLQLPPVTKGNEKRKFAFQSRAWRKSVSMYLELKEVRRQSDKNFVNILQDIRLGRCSSDVCERLQATSKHCITKHGIQATRLCTHKEDVEQINKMQLEKLKSEIKVFEASDSDPMLVKTMDALCPVQQKIELKEGSQVMLTKNLGVQQGLVNGARGVITGFEPGVQGFPKVKFACGVECTLRPERWTVKHTGGVYLTRRQLPLKLAWAISIHKSQGMTLDCVEISLARVFESGQAYVALSRAKSLEGLRVLDFDRHCVRADQDVLNFYQKMKLSSVLQQSCIEKYALGKKNLSQESLW